MKKTTTILAIFAAGLSSATAGVSTSYTSESAPPPSHIPGPVDPITYKNLELLYLHSDIDGLDGDLDGVSLRYEFAVGSNFYLAGSGDYSSGSDTDLWNVRLGVGGYIPLTGNIHLVGEAGVAYFDVETEGYNSPTRGSMGGNWTVEDSDWGWYVRPHLRARWGSFEIHAGAEYQDAYEENWAVYGDIYFQVAPGWDLTAGAREGEDSTQWSAGVRWRY